MESWRLLESDPARGSYNLALDEALFLLARRGRSRRTLRFYAWSQPAVSVGYFQSWDREIDPDVCRSKGIDIYRRVTGGRAVLHRDEVTYSVVCAGSRAFFGEGLQPAYRRIALALAEGLKSLGVDAALAPPAPRGEGRAAGRHPSCFSAKSGYEIDAGGRKLVGSAQKREGDTLLQHGSILVAGHGEEFAGLLRDGARAPSPPSMTSLEELRGCRPSHATVVDALAEGFCRGWGVSFEPGGLTEEEETLAAELEECKYRSHAWNGRRGRAVAAPG
jgi:lipoate-protein ligase A